MKWGVPLLALWLALPAAQAAVFKTDHVTAELVAEQTAVQPGQTLRVGLKIDHQPHWHTYWRNPGDSGLPTTVNWTLPAGASISDIQWPAPHRLPVGPLVNYGYENQLLLPQTLTVPANATPGSTLLLRAQANWLVCKDVCIPEGGELTLQLPVVSRAVMPGSTAHLPTFDQLDAAAPLPLQGWITGLQRLGSELLLTLDATTSRSSSTQAKPVGATSVANEPWPVVHVFPYAEQVLVPARHEVYRTATGYAVKLELMEGASLPESLSGVLVAQTKGGELPPFSWNASPQKAGEFNAPVEVVSALRWPEGATKMPDAGPQGDPVSLRGGYLTRAGGFSWLFTLALAFVGGMLLNLMPCVFPVLSIKLLSLSHNGQQGHHTATSKHQHALAYSLGVVLTFLALAALLLALRAAGQAVGWGFQLQEPWVVLSLALLFFLIGLNLLGSFVWSLALPSGLALWRARHPGVDAFASGVLAVVAASPCTAPFMGAALGFAVTQSAAMALLVFAVLGAGMAAPYVALVLLPGWRERLPKPGPWMLHLKQLLAFPMFLTVLWLLWVLGQQVGVDGLIAATLCLLALGFALWLLAVWKSRPAWARMAALLVVLLALWSASPLDATRASQATASAHGMSRSTVGNDAAWAAYDPAQIDLHLAKGQAVFIDFTAAWCVSCQVNKKLVLDTESTQQAFTKAGVVLMRADWTNRDPVITEALSRLGRNGVPVYVLLRPGKAPLLLPEVLTIGLVQQALATL